MKRARNEEIQKIRDKKEEINNTLKERRSACDIENGSSTGL
jgi:uncharacterized coiled-coil DUF342 family protein